MSLQVDRARTGTSLRVDPPRTVVSLQVDRARTGTSLRLHPARTGIAGTGVVVRQTMTAT